MEPKKKLGDRNGHQNVLAITLRFDLAMLSHGKQKNLTLIHSPRFYWVF